ncbi:hypothetical protein T4B_8652 [Trichinella pseudospiralis]|uniref:Uncharacterized protein n=1 Tax=Trichinella pseudospiralis TaxID=6337 RepID=A0A0V1JET1_TRIPS|nr:hypothetical protein T4B_8652 [Trichinella pseudospiralis]
MRRSSETLQPAACIVSQRHQLIISPLPCITALEKPNIAAGRSQ